MLLHNSATFFLPLSFNLHPAKSFASSRWGLWPGGWVVFSLCCVCVSVWVWVWVVYTHKDACCLALKFCFGLTLTVLALWLFIFHKKFTLICNLLATIDTTQHRRVHNHQSCRHCCSKFPFEKLNPWHVLEQHEGIACLLNYKWVGVWLLCVCLCVHLSLSNRLQWDFCYLSHF